MGVGYIVSQCLNKRDMILKDHDKIEIKSDNTNRDVTTWGCYRWECRVFSWGRIIGYSACTKCLD